MLSDAWAKDGFLVSTPDLFWRQGPGPTADLAFGRDRAGRFDRDQGLRDIEDLIADLRSRPACNGKVAVLGFCFGGRYAHLAAARMPPQRSTAQALGSILMRGQDNRTGQLSFRRRGSGRSDGRSERHPRRFYKPPQCSNCGSRGRHSQLCDAARKPGYDPGTAAAWRLDVLHCFRSM